MTNQAVQPGKELDVTPDIRLRQDRAEKQNPTKRHLLLAVETMNR